MAKVAMKKYWAIYSTCRKSWCLVFFDDEFSVQDKENMVDALRIEGVED